MKEWPGPGDVDSLPAARRQGGAHDHESLFTGYGVVGSLDSDKSG